MKPTLVLALLLLSIYSYSQAPSVQLFNEQKQGGAVIYARNNDVFPTSVLLKLDLTNMSFSEPGQTIFIIPPKTEKFKIGEVTAEENKRYKFSYSYKTTMGDVTKQYDQNYVYDLPFQKGASFKLYQGYNGSFSHRNENALDFTMKEGTPVLAAREGVVVKVVQHNNQSCTTEECKQYNNFVMIMHDDGSFANYVHIRQNGASVKVGDAVKKGDVIAMSGNVGYTSGPHLHFVCFRPDFDKYLTVETTFKIDKGDKVISLSEGTVYTRDY